MKDVLRNRRRTLNHRVEEFPKDAPPYFWIPARVLDCRHAACRRARRCVRPRLVERRPPPRIPSCPLVTHGEWAVWVGMVYPRIRHLLSPDDLWIMAVRRAHYEALMQGW
jgi:hypothetical protein